MYSILYKVRRKRNLVLHRLFLVGRKGGQQQANLSVDYAPSKLFTALRLVLFRLYIG